MQQRQGPFTRTNPLPPQSPLILTLSHIRAMAIYIVAPSPALRANDRQYSLVPRRQEPAFNSIQPDRRHKMANTNKFVSTLLLNPSCTMEIYSFSYTSMLHHRGMMWAYDWSGRFYPTPANHKVYFIQSLNTVYGTAADQQRPYELM